MSIIKSETKFRKVFEEYYIPLCMFAEKFVEGNDIASDIVQECFIILWQKREDFHNFRALRAFLYTSVRNRAINELDRLKTVRHYQSAAADKKEESYFHDHVIEQELQRILISLISRLPEQCQKVMRLAVQGYKNSEIAELLGIAEGTVHTHKKHAYKKLRAQITDKNLNALLYMFVW